MPASKADQVEKERRIEQAVAALLDGQRVQTVAIAFQEQYSISQAVAYEYTKEATARIHKKIDKNIDNHIARHLQRLERLYQKSVKVEDRRTARQILKDQADLLGLDAPKRTDITSGGEPIKSLIEFVGLDDDGSDEDQPATDGQ